IASVAPTPSSRGAPVDAVLMDMLMPRLDGVGATLAIRNGLGRTDLPIIAMTANAMDSDRAECLAAGMVDHLAKPIVLSEIVATILRHVRHATPPPLAVHGHPAVAAAPAAEVLDTAGAIARLGGDRALFGRLLPVFQSNLAQARDALASNLQGEELCRLLHTLKSTAATMGAGSLAACAKGAEERLRAGMPVGEAGLPDVAASIDEGLHAIEQLIAGGRAQAGSGARVTS
ncbi:MAG: response regulator, partial [Comamonadaceae bacterium]